MTLYKHSSYRSYLKEYIQSRPHGGRGEIAKMSAHLHIHSTLMSLIVSGKRMISFEQAYDLCDYLKLSEAETEYFLLLAHYEKAGNHRLKKHFQEKIEKAQSDYLQLKNFVKNGRELKESEKAIFYSSWLYSAIRLYCSTAARGKNLEEISSRFQISRTKSLEIVQFLVKSGLLTEKNSKFIFQTQKTYIPFGSPFSVRNHLNWRTRALNHCDQLTSAELMITSPFSISKSDFQKIKELILQMTKNVSDLIKDSEAEEVAALNIDLFWVR